MDSPKCAYLTLTRARSIRPAPDRGEKTWQSFFRRDKTDHRARNRRPRQRLARVSNYEAAQLEQMAARRAPPHHARRGPVRDAVASVYDQARGRLRTESTGAGLRSRRRTLQCLRQ